ncbi:MAG: enoyl-CoA hydratase/isomerase family protein [Haloferacaceae archaeon]
MSGLVTFECEGSVGTVTFRRPEVGNQVNLATMRALIDALEQAGDSDADVLVLRGEGETFCVGRDQDEEPEDLSFRENLSLILTANELWRDFDGVTVAAVSGDALGFGCGLALQADVTIAAEDAQLGFTEIHHGFAPTIVLTYIETFLPRKRALDLVMTGRTVPAEEAREMGMVTRVAPSEGFEGAVDSFVDTLAGLNADALRTCKFYMREIGDVPPEERGEYALDTLTGGD